MVYIVRHGETDDNTARIFVRDETPLNERGRREVKDAIDQSMCPGHCFVCEDIYLGVEREGVNQNL